MAQAVHVKPSGTRILTAGSALSSGDVVLVTHGAGNKIGIVQGLNNVVSGDPYSVALVGVFAIASASAATFAVGAKVYWDNTAKAATATATANTYMGVADKAKVAGDLTVDVDLNLGVVTAP